MSDNHLVAGIRFDDAEMASSLRSGLERVERLLLEACRSDDRLLDISGAHLAAAGGKRFRPLLVQLAAQFGEVGRPEVDKAAAVVELTHLATLYHDDVMDEAEIRRGAPSANARWSNSVAILTGDFLFARASLLVAQLGTEAVRIQAETFERLVVGQIRETVEPPEGVDPVENYLGVLAAKTGSLIATSGRFGAMFSGCSDEIIDALTGFGESIGMAFQLSDDLIDITSDATELGKATGTDLREGVRTLPMLYALEDADTTDPELLKLLGDGPLIDDERHGRALELLRASPAMDQARDTLLRYVDEALESLQKLPRGVARDSLSSLVEFMRLRNG